MSFKRIFFVFSLFVYLFSFILASDITFCSPNTFPQDIDEVNISILFAEQIFDPCKYMGKDYPIISFSSPKIKVISNKISPFFIKATVSVDKTIEPKNYDIKIISCNEKGEKKLFTKKDAITVLRKSVIKDLIVKTPNKKVTRGKDALITIQGENFEKGDVRVTIVMSGVLSEVVKCKNSNLINFNLKGSVSKNILPGEYAIYIVNHDGTNAVSSNKIIIE